MIGPDLRWTRERPRALNSGGPGADRGDRHVYRRRYLDEDVWELVDVHTVELALSDVYHDVSLALDVLYEAGSIRTPAAVFEAQAT